MKRKTLIAAFAAITALLIHTGCGHRQQSLTVRVFVDGTDVVKIAGPKLWLEHDSFELPGKTIYVNGAAWTPKWENKMSAPLEGVNPAFLPRDAKSVQLTKRAGRGDVSIVEMPSPENNGTLTLRVNDDDFAGADWYEFVVSW